MKFAGNKRTERYDLVNMRIQWILVLHTEVMSKAHISPCPIDV